MSLTLFVDNVFSRLQYSGHVVTATEESADHGVNQVVSARRDLYNYWAGITPNQVQYVQVVCNVARTVNAVAMDWNHNWAGRVCTIRGSNNSFASHDVLKTSTVPSSAGGTLAGANGAVTNEGAWLASFTGGAYTSFRFEFAAVSGAIPQIPNIWLGSSYVPTFVVRPYSYDRDQFVGELSTPFLGKTGTGRTARIRQMDLNVKLKTPSSYTDFYTHVHSKYGSGRLMWVIRDAAPERSWCCRRVPTDVLGLEFGSDWGFEQGVVKLVEYSPRLVTV